MKIEIKLTADELQYLSSALEAVAKIDIKRFNELQHDRKLMISILVDVADKLAGKFEKISRKPSLFDGRKKYQSTLSYHEAYALWTYLTGALNLETDTYRKTMARKVHAKLDPTFV